MKYSKRYIVFTSILLIAFFLKLNNWNDEYAEVVNFRGASLQDEVFYPLKARSINEEGKLQLVVGEDNYGSRDGVFMGDHMQMLISLDLAQDLFGCSAKGYDGERVEVHYNSETYFFPFNDFVMRHAGQEINLLAPAELHGEEAYLPIADLCKLVNCEYVFDQDNLQGIISSDITRGNLPATFDLRGNNRAAKVRDQGSSATCWAQASLTALESSLLPQETKSYSVEHMVEDNGFKIAADQGGEYTMSAAYLLAWQGPVEKNSVDKHVQELHFYDHDKQDEIKWAVYQHGGVSTSIYANISTSNLSKSTYYNKKENSYYYGGNKEPNHDVVIIGWNDNYSKDNFSEPVPGDGAFVCQNSWGASFGEKGVFYVSYYDTNIGNQSVSYAKVEDKNNYDSIYQSDICGWIGQIGFNKSKIHGANVFTAAKSEEIVSAGFYALGENTTYQLYMVPKYQDKSSLANRVEVASGTLKDAGFYTIPFDKGYRVEKGDKFALVLVLSTPDREHPMAIEYVSDDRTKNVDITDGEGYISANGLDWDRVEETAKGNLCIKAYGKQFVEKDK